ncbi:MFS transporter [Streptomyces turgidiscabies]|uniref:MFS family arabinose efflux permease n=1 Tax=Streptomyces turgidiscabies TaxID=85558 RepID=A0ABU0RLN4_9ACTN|nr:MFS transporter [Streptomyces turgidiscabies]MDQ0932879.1 putative MFS family arabinose efflux permease [Streptomyces turgidiscabies]
MRPDSPWRTADFRTLFTASALSQLGSNVSYVAVPLVAVAALDAGPGQVGALATLSTIAFLVIGLPAGAWVDRLSHRRVLIAADLCRALLYASVPLAWWLDALTLGQLYAVVLLSGCATVFFDVGSQSVLPQLVGKEALVQANADINTLIAAGNVLGRSAGGGLVSLLTAPAAVLVSAGTYLASGLGLIAIRRTQPSTVAKNGASNRLRAQIAEGVRHVFGNPELRALVLTAALANLGSSVINTMLPIWFVRELGLPGAALGLFWGAGGIGLLIGARSARPIAARLGFGRTLGLAGVCLAPAGLLVPLVDRGPWLFLAGAGWCLAMFKVGMDNVLGVSLRQRMTPGSLLGRMNATFRFLLTGALAVGAAISGVLGELVGVQATLWVGGVFVSTAFLPVFLSPVRARRVLPDPVPEPEPPHTQDAPATPA